MEKGEIAHFGQFQHFPQCFLQCVKMSLYGGKGQTWYLFIVIYFLHRNIEKKNCWMPDGLGGTTYACVISDFFIQYTTGRVRTEDSYSYVHGVNGFGQTAEWHVHRHACHCGD